MPSSRAKPRLSPRLKQAWVFGECQRPLGRTTRRLGAGSGRMVRLCDKRAVCGRSEANRTITAHDRDVKTTHEEDWDMADIYRDGRDWEVTGTQIYIAGAYRTVIVADTPSEIRALIGNAEESLVALRATQDMDVLTYVDARKIIALEPVWSEVRENAGQTA